MNSKLLVGIFLALALGIGTGLLMRNSPFKQPSASLETGNYGALYAAHGSRVILYSLKTCLDCKRARMLLDKNRIRYKELFVDESGQARQEAKKLHARKVPLILAGNSKIEGFDEQKILQLLQKEGMVKQ